MPGLIAEEPPDAFASPSKGGSSINEAQSILESAISQIVSSNCKPDNMLVYSAFLRFRKKRPATARKLFISLIEKRIANDCPAMQDVLFLFALETRSDTHIPKQTQQAVDTILEYGAGENNASLVRTIKSIAIKALAGTTITVNLASLVMAVEEVTDPQAAAAAMRYLFKLQPESNSKGQIHRALGAIYTENVPMDRALSSKVREWKTQKSRPAGPQSSTDFDLSLQAAVESQSWGELARIAQNVKDERTGAKALKAINSSLAILARDSADQAFEHFLVAFRGVAKVLSKPDLVKALSNGLFNLGSRSRPRPISLEIWSLSLLSETGAGIVSSHALEKVSRFCQALASTDDISFYAVLARTIELLVMQSDDLRESFSNGAIPDQGAKLLAALGAVTCQTKLATALFTVKYGPVILLHAHALRKPQQDGATMAKALELILSGEDYNDDLVAASIAVYASAASTFPVVDLDRFDAKTISLRNLRGLLNAAAQSPGHLGFVHRVASTLLMDSGTSDDVLWLEPIVSFCGFAKLSTSMPDGQLDGYGALTAIARNPEKHTLKEILQVQRHIRGGEWQEFMEGEEIKLAVYVLRAQAEVLIRGGQIPRAIPLLQKLVFLSHTWLQSKPILDAMTKYLDAVFQLSQMFWFVGSFKDCTIHLTEAHQKAKSLNAHVRATAYNAMLAKIDPGHPCGPEPADELLSTLSNELVAQMTGRLDASALSKLASQLNTEWKRLTSTRIDLHPSDAATVISTSSTPKAPTENLPQEIMSWKNLELELRDISKGVAWEQVRVSSVLFAKAAIALSVLKQPLDASYSVPALTETSFSYVTKFRQAKALRHTPADEESVIEPPQTLNPDRVPVVAVTIGFQKPDSLLLTRTVDGVHQYALAIPVTRMSELLGEKVASFQDMRQSLTSIVEDARSHATNQAQAAAGETEIDSRTWWKTQVALNNTMKDLLQQIETRWFGGFRGAFNTQTIVRDDNYREAMRAITSLLTRYLKPLILGRSSNWVLDIPPEAGDFFLFLGDTQLRDKTASVEDLIIYVLDYLRAGGVQFDYEDVPTGEMAGMLLPVLVHYRSKIASQDTRHLVLMPTADCHEIPWESMEFLRKVVSSRALSFSHLAEMSKLESLDTANINYVLNPSRDLANTQQNFETEFRLRGWKGIAGRVPGHAELETLVEKSTCYVYLGHGSGNAYIRGSAIKKMKQCGSVMLFGCSSAKLTRVGGFDSFGPVTDYAIAGSPLFIGNLWDIPDKDLNRFTKEFLGRVFDDGEDVCSALSEARNACLLRYTTGAAPIIYGLPVRTDKAQAALSA